MNASALDPTLSELRLAAPVAEYLLSKRYFLGYCQRLLAAPTPISARAAAREQSWRSTVLGQATLPSGARPTDVGLAYAMAVHMVRAPLEDTLVFDLATAMLLAASLRPAPSWAGVGTLLVLGDCEVVLHEALTPKEIRLVRKEIRTTRCRFFREFLAGTRAARSRVAKSTHRAWSNERATVWATTEAHARLYAFVLRGAVEKIHWQRALAATREDLRRSIEAPTARQGRPRAKRARSASTTIPLRQAPAP